MKKSSRGPLMMLDHPSRTETLRYPKADAASCAFQLDVAPRFSDWVQGRSSRHSEAEQEIRVAPPNPAKGRAARHERAWPGRYIYRALLIQLEKWEEIHEVTGCAASTISKCLHASGRILKRNKRKYNPNYWDGKADKWMEEEQARLSKPKIKKDFSDMPLLS